MRINIMLKTIKKVTFFSLLIIGNSFVFGQNSIENEQIESSTKPQIHQPLQSYQVGVFLGYGYRIAPASHAITSFDSKLRNNYNLGIAFSYYLKGIFGFGIRYNGILTHAYAEDIPYTFQNGSVSSLTLSEIVGMHHFAAFISIRTFFGKNRHCVYGNIGTGYARYSDEAAIKKGNPFTINDFSKKIKVYGNTAAFVVETGYDFLVSQSFAIGLQVSMSLGWLSVLHHTENGFKWKEQLGKGSRENLSHIDFSIAFRLYN